MNPLELMSLVGIAVGRRLALLGLMSLGVIAGGRRPAALRLMSLGAIDLWAVIGGEPRAKRGCRLGCYRW